MGIYDELLGYGALPSEKPRPVPGIVIGIVKENWEQKHPGMVRVEYSLGEEGKNRTGWVPVMSPYAGKDFGFYALPEVGDEVVVAFAMGDRNCPVVLGSVWSRKNTLPKETAKDKNPVKRLLTKGGCEIVFEEEKGKEQIRIRTPKELTLLLEDEKEKITLADQNGKNGLVIDAKNGTVSMLAEKSVEIKVGGKAMAAFDGKAKSMTLAAGKITGNADQSMALKGQTFKAEGTQVEIKGSGSLKLESSGVTQVKGSMLQLN